MDTVHNGYRQNYHYIQFITISIYSDKLDIVIVFAALGVPPSKSHTYFIGYSDIIIGYSYNSCTDLKS